MAPTQHSRALQVARVAGPRAVEEVAVDVGALAGVRTDELHAEGLRHGDCRVQTLEPSADGRRGRGGLARLDVAVGALPGGPMRTCVMQGTGRAN